ncbi:hypothetical protein SORBI_3006G036201 [Sorghum bicolor]|uniref:Uncharacterized protein n=2 Tax=Sorghum bicolor TaxID=4558 RepID=A0A1Z5RBZ2_SORBI|nr:hypothetical protein SORBI_3006G036201 [Sorghum bicolor]OQU81283.1 hypothetical protein SORBI_3006G036201 [Sorghum bicolor]
MLGLIMMLAFSPIQVYLMPGHPINTRMADIQLACYKTNANPKLPFTPLPSPQQPPSSIPHHHSCLSMSRRPCHWGASSFLGCAVSGLHELLLAGGHRHGR